jgi:beta-lactamase class A
MFRSARLTNPYLESPGQEAADPWMARTREAIADLVRSEQERDPTLRVSVYARDLENGPWIGVNDRELYFPSSLTKVPVLVHTLHLAEGRPELLERRVLFPGSQGMVGEDTMRDAPDSLRLVPGSEYSVRRLLENMIVYSDNHAWELLLGLAQEEGSSVSGMMYDLSAEETRKDGQFLFEPRTLAVLLRALYNSSYLSRAHSEYALDLLTRTTFSDGLRRLLPPEAVVASKFGYHASRPGDPPHHQLHECGITYRPRSPYVACVMTATQSGRPDDLAPIIGEISRILWSR